MAAQLALPMTTNLLPSISSIVNSAIIKGNKRHAVKEELEELTRILSSFSATLHDAEKWEIKDHSAKIWLRELRDAAHCTEDLFDMWQIKLNPRVQMAAAKTSEALLTHKMEYIPNDDDMAVELKKIRNRFQKLSKDRVALLWRNSDSDGYIAEERKIRGCEILQSSKNDEVGCNAEDEKEFREREVLQTSEGDEVGNVADKREIKDHEALQSSGSDEVEYTELRDIRDHEVLQLRESDEFGCLAENREMRDSSEIRRVTNSTAEVGEYQSGATLAQPLQLNSNLSHEGLHVLNDGTIEHSKRLKSYAKGSMASITPFGISIFMSALKEQGNAIFVNATYICLVSSFLPNFIVMLLNENSQMLSKNCFPHQQKDHLHIFIYGSTFVLMLCGLFPLLASNAKYGPLAIFPVLALVIIICLFVRGCKFGHTRSATSYREHDGKLKYYSKFYSAATTATFSGLSAIIFSSPQQIGVKPTEIFLYIAVFTSLLLMQLTSVPPAVSHQTMRTRVMEAMRYLFSTMVGLLFLVALLAVGAVLQGVISILIYITGFVSFVVVVVINERKVQLRARNEPIEEAKLDSLALVVVGFTLSNIMAVYSKYVDDRTKVHNQYFLLLLCIVCACTSFITSLSKALLVSGTASEAWPRAKMISSCISYALAFVAVIFSYLLYRGQ